MADNSGPSFNSKLKNPTEKSHEEGYSDCVDVLKGICILFIIVTHFGWSDETRLHLLFPYWIDMAVPVFMILSGFVMAKSYERRDISSFEKAYSYKLILKCILRFLIPFSMIHILITIAILVNGFRTGNPDILYSLRYFVTGFLNGGIGQGSYYYVIMLQFVFVFPVIYFVIKRTSKGLIICFVCNILYEILKTAYSMNEECYRLLIFRYIFAISVGTYVATYGVNKAKNKMMILSVFLGALYIFIMRYTSYNPIILTYWKGTSVLAVLFIAPIIVYILIKFSTYEINNLKVLRLLGKASYNIFLVQMAYYIFDGFIAEYLTNNLVHLVICILICSFTGVIFYKIEQPVTRFIVSKLCNTDY